MPASPKRRNLDKNFIKKNMMKVIFGGRAPSLPPPPTENKYIPDDKSSVSAVNLHKNFGKVPK
jgi:hypothetical protein